MSFRIRFKVSIVSVLLAVILLLGLPMLVGLWLISSEIAEDFAGSLFETTSHNVQDNIKYLFEGALTTASYGAVQPDVSNIANEGIKSKNIPTLIEILSQQDTLYSIYYGFENGNFLQVISVGNSDLIRDKHKAPPETKWIVRSIFDLNSQRIQRWVFLDENRKYLSEFDETSPSYDPRKRPWYQSVVNTKETKLSSPYIFNSIKEPGITASKKLVSGDGVFGVDMMLTGLSQRITNLDVSKNGKVLLYDTQNRLLGMTMTSGKFGMLESVLKIPDIAAKISLKAQNHQKQGVLQKIDQAGESFFASYYLEELPGIRLNLVIVAPETDFTGHFRNLQKQFLLICGLGVILFIPVSYMFSSKLASQVSKLARNAERAKDMIFETGEVSESRIVEFDNLIKAFHTMNKNLAHKTDELKLEQDKLSRLVELGIAMSAEQDSNKLMEMVLLGAKELTNADGGTLYTLDDEGKLQFSIVRNDSLDIQMGGTSGNPVQIPPVHLFREGDQPNFSNVVSFAVHKEKSVNIEDAYNADDFDFSGTRIFDKNNGYRSQSFLTVPLKPRGGDVIGALQIINARKEGTGEVVPFNSTLQPFVEALAAQAATALYNRELLKAQEKLMDSLIQLIAGAIDAKSPYTGGHCERVPELAVMLAHEASKVETGHLADFNFKTREELREFEIGAWLHDCGKVTTPEYVVDKATKLETIYNRIHEIRTRFEVLLRDSEIEYLKSLARGIEKSEAEKIFVHQQKELFDDFAFVAECNLGGEFMEDSKIDRLKRIADTSWTRHFDITLGLSHDEKLRYEDEPDGPCEEKLLNDKILHIIPRERLISEQYKNYDFKVDIPENLYNQGEMYNLCVKRGTLTEEERFKINEHIMQTIVMLEQLPLPQHLKRIPEYAGAHHETMVGTGYPRKMTEKELSIPSRIMAIADIFEALTASDRPYKQPKTLSEAVKILSFFKKDRHIDPILFDLFLTSGTYRSYANKFLDPEQIDDVDITAYLN
ncbi:MAG: GAF domain-containing protein [Rhodospirillales bacterium]|nr:GAF domain-containing protein [Rhodospirillales bacterium]